MLGPVKPGVRTLGLFAILFSPCFAGGAGTLAEPEITLVEKPATVSFTLAVPRYTLTVSERDTVAACLVLEAASQGDLGMRGVMAVIRNRARDLPELFAPTVLRRKQFSALNKFTSGRGTLSQAIEKAKRDRSWPRALAIVDEAAAASWWDPTGGATHYTLSTERNHWTRKLKRTTIIGAHAFYR